MQFLYSALSSDEIKALYILLPLLEVIYYVFFVITLVYVSYMYSSLSYGPHEIF